MIPSSQVTTEFSSRLLKETMVICCIFGTAVQIPHAIGAWLSSDPTNVRIWYGLLTSS